MKITEKSLKADIYAAFLEARTEIELVRNELEALKNKKVELITWKAQKDNVLARYQIHQKEVEAVKVDVVAFSAWFERTIKSLSQQLAQG
tara:strand:- start:653 stop:922 length:270 start_codon:yes stop_codon:yes gene_type:complete